MSFRDMKQERLTISDLIADAVHSALGGDVAYCNMPGCAVKVIERLEEYGQVIVPASLLIEAAEYCEKRGLDRGCEIGLKLRAHATTKGSDEKVRSEPKPGKACPHGDFFTRCDICTPVLPATTPRKSEGGGE